MMEEKQLRKLKREQLLELLLEMSEEKDRLQEKLDEANRELERREVILKNAGSIADAAVQITGILEKAQETADLYLRSVMQSHPENDGKSN